LVFCLFHSAIILFIAAPPATGDQL